MRAIVPVKRFCSAKQRLAGVRTPGERAELARALAARTLREIFRAKLVEGATVVSAEASLRPLVRDLGFDWLEDAGDGLNAALAAALDDAAARRCDDVAIVHADLPLLEAAEFDRVAALHLAGPPRKMTLVADRRGDGTNVRFCRPARAVPPLYGPGSARRHAVFARACGIPVYFVRSPALSVDCDTPDDLEFLAEGAGAPQRPERAAS